MPTQLSSPMSAGLPIVVQWRQDISPPARSWSGMRSTGTFPRAPTAQFHHQLSHDQILTSLAPGDGVAGTAVDAARRLGLLDVHPWQSEARAVQVQAALST